MYVKQVSYPSTLPISRTEAKGFCKVPEANTGDDWLFDLLIASAVAYAESATGLSLASKDFVLYLDEFPSFPFVGSAYAPLFGAFPFYFGYGPATNYPTASPFRESERLPFVIPLQHPPVTAVTKIVYLTQDGTEGTLLPGQDFVADLGSEPARVGPLPGGRWPIGMVAMSSVQVFYTAGYTAGAADVADNVVSNAPTPPDQTTEYKFVTAIPADLKVAMLMLIADAYFNREPNVAGAVGRVPTVDNILVANRVWDYAPARN